MGMFNKIKAIFTGDKNEESSNTDSTNDKGELKKNYINYEAQEEAAQQYEEVMQKALNLYSEDTKALLDFFENGIDGKDNKQTKISEMRQQVESSKMEDCIDAINEIEEGLKRRKLIEISAIKGLRKDIIKDLERYISMAEKLGIGNLDYYRKLLEKVENIQIQDKVTDELKGELKEAREHTDKLLKKINNYFNKEDPKGDISDKTRDGRIEKNNGNTNIVKENENKNTQESPRNGNIGRQSNEDYDEPMFEEWRNAMREWHESQTNPETQNEGSLKNKDEEKTNLEKEDKDIEERLRQKWDKMLGL